MKFDDLDAKMRCYEQSIDQYVLPDMYLVASHKIKLINFSNGQICSYHTYIISS